MVVLLGRALYRGVRPPFSYGPEFVAQFRFTLKICLFPLLLVSFALSFGPAGVQASNVFGLFGALDRMGAAWQVIVLRWWGPLSTAVVLAGAAGTAICADLGARVVREEIAALRVLGVDTTKNLVAPRLFVLAICAVLFSVFSILSGMLGALLVLAQNHQPIGPFLDVFFANASLVELSAALIKSAIYGAAIAVVCCHKGMNVSGGAEGVGRAVNECVVINFLLIVVIDYAFTQFVLATNPILSTPRG